jgi:hypothetical protein
MRRKPPHDNIGGPENSKHLLPLLQDGGTAFQIMLQECKLGRGARSKMLGRMRLVSDSAEDILRPRERKYDRLCGLVIRVPG